MPARLTVLGFRSGKPDAVSPCSGYLVEDRGRRILVDCGPGIMAQLIARDISLELDAVVLAHLHQDHCLDIVPLAHNRLLPHASAPRIPLFAPEQALSALRALDDWLEVPSDPDVRLPLAAAFDIRPLPGDGSTTTLPGGIPLASYSVRHAVPSTALRMKLSSGVLTFSSDTGWCDGLLEAAREADVFVCEATYPRKDPAMLAEHGHLTADLTGRCAQEAGVGHLVVSHLMGEDDSGSLLLAREAAPDVSRCTLAQVGLVLDVAPEL